MKFRNARAAASYIWAPQLDFKTEFSSCFRPIFVYVYIRQSFYCARFYANGSSMQSARIYTFVGEKSHEHSERDG